MSTLFLCFTGDTWVCTLSNFCNSLFFENFFQQHLSEINDPLVEQAILDNLEDVYYKDDSFDSSLHELQVKFTKSEIQTWR